MMGLTVFVEAVAHFFIEAFKAYAAGNYNLLEALFEHPFLGFGDYGLPQVLPAVFRQHHDAPARSHSFVTRIICIVCTIYIFFVYLYKNEHKGRPP